MDIWIKALRIVVWIVFLFFVPGAGKLSASASVHTEAYTSLDARLIEIYSNPDEGRMERFFNELESAFLNTHITLQETNLLLARCQDFLADHPPYYKFAYRYRLVQAIIKLAIGDRADCYSTLREIQEDLRSEKRWRELYHFNLSAANFLFGRDTGFEYKRFYYENESLQKEGLIEDKPIDRGVRIQNANALAFAYRTEGNFDSAAYFFKIALSRARANQDSIWIGIISGNLGSALYKLGFNAEAETLLWTDASISMSQKQFSSAINALLSICDNRIRQKAWQEAYRLILKCDSLLHLISRDEKAAYSLYNIEFNKRLAIVLLNLDKKDEAVRSFTIVLDSIASDIGRRRLDELKVKFRNYELENRMIEISDLEEEASERFYWLWVSAALLIIAISFIILQLFFTRKLRGKNKEIAEQKAALLELNNQKNKLFSIVAHDIRNPLANLRSLLDMHGDNMISQAEFLQYRESINTSLKSINGLLENILSWTKAGMTQGITPVLKTVAPDQVIRKLMNQLDPLAGIKEVKFSFQDNAETPVWADEELMMIILRNLMHNAIKFSPEGETVSIVLERSTVRKDFIAIQIIDNGNGMEQSRLDKLFSGEYSGASSPGTLGEKGTGLGIMICREFTWIIGGYLSATSVSGKGSVFILELPVFKS